MFKKKEKGNQEEIEDQKEQTPVVPVHKGESKTQASAPQVQVVSCDHISMNLLAEVRDLLAANLQAIRELVEIARQQ